MKILRRSEEPFCDPEAGWLWRAHVWTDRGYHTKTFLTESEARTWVPK